ncbi:hypothetical protein ACS0TY_003960 [Phlomoides rotata]
MNYIYVMSGWEGCVADNRILRDAVTQTNGLRVPTGSSGVLQLEHAKARNYIERSFGILKERWGILKSNSHYPIKMQNRFILGCCLLHNFIRAHMVVDPYKDDVPESFTNVNDVNETIDGFIDQVEHSQVWISWRDNLAMEILVTLVNRMDISSNLNIGERVINRVVPNSRQIWTYPEEMKLVCALKELVVKGKKCDNGFKSGYLLLLENMLANKFSGTDLKGDSYINSKIHVWKK